MRPMALLWFTRWLCTLHELALWPNSDLSIVGQTGNVGGRGRLKERIGTSWMREWNSPVMIWAPGEILGPNSEGDEQEWLICTYYYVATFPNQWKLSFLNILFSFFLASYLIHQSCTISKNFSHMSTLSSMSVCLPIYHLLSDAFLALANRSHTKAGHPWSALLLRTWLWMIKIFVLPLLTTLPALFLLCVCLMYLKDYFQSVSQGPKKVNSRKNWISWIYVFVLLLLNA